MKMATTAVHLLLTLLAVAVLATWASGQLPLHAGLPWTLVLAYQAPRAFARLRG